VVIGHKIATTTDPNKKGQTMIYKTLHRKLKIEKNEPHKKPGVNSGAPEGYANFQRKGGLLWVLRFPPPIKLTATI
jgi:hypothetical protein